MSYTYTNLLPGEFRILELLPGSDRGLEARLVTTSLTQKPKYEALSYCWGPQTTFENVSIGADYLEVTTSLASALRALRFSDRSRLLWVDQICINQMDNLEKSVQVGKLMASIYSNTSQLLIWLGDRDDEGDVAIEAIKDLLLEVEEFGSEEDIARRDMSGWDPRGKDGGRDVNTWIAIFKFFKRPWFSRVWEIYLPETEDIKVYYGQHELLWRHLSLVEAISHKLPSKWYGSESQTLTRGHGFHMRSVPLNVTIKHLKTIKAVQNHRRHDGRLLSVLYNFLGRKSTDARDKVFAVQSLCVDPLIEKLQVDYEKDVVDIFSETTRSMIEEYQNLDVFVACQLDRNLSGLPSWVPDWTVGQERRPLRPMTLLNWRNDLPDYKAFPSRNPKIGKPSRKDELVLSGYKVKLVNKTSSDRDETIWETSKMHDPHPFFKEVHELSGRSCPNLPLRTPTEEEVEALWPSSDPKRALHDSLVLLAQDTRRSEQLGSLRLPSEKYSELDGLLDRAWGLVGRPRPNREVNANALISAYLSLLPVQFDPYPEDSAIWATLIMGKFDFNRYAESPVNPKLDQGGYMNAFLQALSGRRFFVTEDDDIGMGPYLMQSGDAVCLLPGATTPYILRETSGHWILVGECYCHGLMDGVVGKRLLENGEKELFSIV